MMKNKFLFLLGAVVFLFAGCIIHPHKYYWYKSATGEPYASEYPEIDRKKYSEYFIDDIYVSLFIDATPYYYEKIRERAPYGIMFNAKTSKDVYEKIALDEVIISSSLGKIYDGTPALHSKNFYGGNSSYFTRYYYQDEEEKEKRYSYNFDVPSKEEITIQAHFTVYRKDGETIDKWITFRFLPHIKRELFEVFG